GNTDLIIADSGYISTMNDDKYLIFELFSGKSYSENTQHGNRNSDQFFINDFDKSKMVFSLASFELNRTREELFSSNRMMKNVRELRDIKDSVRKDYRTVNSNLEKSLVAFYSYLPKVKSEKENKINNIDSTKLKKLDSLSLKDKEVI